jgi:hypothetical protein
MPEPGWIPPITAFSDDCYRQALACASGLSLASLPHISSDELADLSPTQIDEIWQAIMRVLGWELHESGAVDVDGQHFWLAVVDDSSRNNLHVVVMRGRNLWFDPERKRVRRPSKFYEKWYLGFNG